MSRKPTSLFDASILVPAATESFKKLDPRVMMGIGFLGFGIGTWWASYITRDWAFGELVVPQIFRGVSLMVCMIPINNVALGTLPPDRIKNASGLFNLTRNLGLPVTVTDQNNTDLSRASIYGYAHWQVAEPLRLMHGVVHHRQPFRLHEPHVAVRHLAAEERQLVEQVL